MWKFVTVPIPASALITISSSALAGIGTVTNFHNDLQSMNNHKGWTQLVDLYFDMTQEYKNVISQRYYQHAKAIKDAKLVILKETNAEAKVVFVTPDRKYPATAIYAGDKIKDLKLGNNLLSKTITTILKAKE